MLDFSDFDTRHHRTVDVATGYDGWSTTYDDSVLDAMDLALLERLSEPDGADLAVAADLGCGTGRTGAWLRGKGLSRVDGVDLSRGCWVWPVGVLSTTGWSWPMCATVVCPRASTIW